MDAFPKIEFATLIGVPNFNLQAPGEEPEEPTIPLHLTFEYEFPSGETGQQAKDLPTVERELRERLEASNWTILDKDSGPEDLIATAPDGTEHGVTIEDFSSVRVSYLHRIEVLRAVR